MWSSKVKATDAQEQEAVVELRKRLEDGTQPVEEQLRKGGEPGLGDGLDDQTLLRWLRAEDNDVSKAEKRLRKHAVWRMEEFPQGHVTLEEIPDELGFKKVYLAGNDKFGREVMVLKVNRHLRAKREIKQMNRFLCYSLDLGIKHANLEKNPSGKLCGIFDLRDISMANIDNAALRGVFDMLQNHYPERLGTLWMYESPSIFWVLWKAVSPFIDPVTRSKVRFVTEKTGPAEMREEINDEALPKDFGGQADLVSIEEAPPPKPQKLSQSQRKNESESNVTSVKLQTDPATTSNSKTENPSPNADKYPASGQVMGP